MPWIIFFSAILLLLLLGIRQKAAHRRALAMLPLRINVNGIRGKSTVTRLIFEILKEAGYKVIGKTTGSATRLFHWNQDGEVAIKRRRSGTSISEQMRVIAYSAAYGADALVCECMAVRPDYQEVYQRDMLQANISVIVNVLKDHLDEMGPTTEQISWAFAKSIPNRGVVCVTDDAFLPYFSARAAERGSRVMAFDEAKIPEVLMSRLADGIFPANCAAALAVSDTLGIDRAVAIKAIMQAKPDPGSLKVREIPGASPGFFIDAFAANEPESSLKIWKALGRTALPMQNPLVLFNARSDRVDRSQLFATDFFPAFPTCEVMVIGEVAGQLVKACRGLQNITAVHDLSDKSTDEILNALLPLAEGRAVFGVGNLHGSAEKLIGELEARDLYKIPHHSVLQIRGET